MCLIIYSGEPHLEQFLTIFTKPTFCKSVILPTVQLCFLHLNIYRTLNFVSSLETCLSYPNVFHTKFIVQEQFCVYKSSKILKIKFSSILGIEKTSITRERDRQSGNREHHDDQRRKVPLNFLFQKVRWRTWRPLDAKTGNDRRSAITRQRRDLRLRKLHQWKRLVKEFHSSQSPTSWRHFRSAPEPQKFVKFVHLLQHRVRQAEGAASRSVTTGPSPDSWMMVETAGVFGGT